MAIGCTGIGAVELSVELLAIGVMMIGIITPLGVVAIKIDWRGTLPFTLDELLLLELELLAFPLLELLELLLLLLLLLFVELEGGRTVLFA